MKKALSLFLAVLMMFSVMAIGASAEDTEPLDTWDYQGYPAKSNQSILVLDLANGKFRDAQPVYNLQTGKIERRELSASEMAEKFVWVPADDSDFVAGSKVTLPVVTGPKGYQFDGWYCVTDGNTYGAVPGGYTVPADGSMAGKTIEFRAAYSPVAPEQDTFAKVFDILIKVFGTIYGLLTGGDTAKGIATMKKLFAGLMD
ncbi:MAG: hypothetical protein IJL52_01245 [Clostridia bacterium]|nr:hypothetical protein [Clostridia bacterium]